MTADPLALSPELVTADARLQATLAALPESALAEPSRLPGWTRGHVLSHIARNADALNNLLTWARTGVETPAYASAGARVAGIEEGAYRPLDVQIEDVRTASARFAAAAADMPASAWAAVLSPRYGNATQIVWRRLREVEVHHVDLDAGYEPAGWPPAFTHRLLRELVHDRPVPDGTPPVEIVVDGLAHRLRLGDGTPATAVSGPDHALAAWLSGRSDGAGLVVSPPGPLPAIPDWI